MRSVRLGGAVRLTIGFMLLGLLTVSPAAASAGGGISGVVTNAVAAGGVITGTVWYSSSDAPVGGAEIDLLDSSGNEIDSTCSGSDGTYTFVGLSTGSYSLTYNSSGFYGPCGPQVCYDVQAGPQNPVSVTAGGTTLANFYMARCPSSVTGTVTDATTEAPVEGATVTGYDTSGHVLGATTTDSTGAYTLSIPADNNPIKVGFSAGAGYFSQFYKDEPSLQSADLITLSCTKTDFCWAQNIDANLVETPGQILGTVTDAASHAPIQGATVNIYDSGDTVVGSATTNSNGLYTVSGVAPGTYQVGFAATGYVSQFYKGEPTLAAADAVTVTPDAPTSGIDAALNESPAPPTSAPPTQSVNPTPTPTSPVKPTLTHLSETHKRFRAGSELATFARTHAPVGTTFSFILDTASTVRFRFMRSVAGRRINGRCARTTDKHKPACSRMTLVASLTYSAAPGSHALQFAGRISRSRKLRPGRYQLVVTAIDSAGRSQPQSIRFTIVK